MNKMECQTCNGTGDQYEKDSGCSNCGGYGTVLTKGKCGGCGREYWEKAGCHTIYPGKRWRSFDGLTFVVQDNLESRCVHCIRVDS